VLGTMASASVSPATNRRAKPRRIPCRAMASVTRFFVDSQKIRFRSNVAVSVSLDALCL